MEEELKQILIWKQQHYDEYDKRTISATIELPHAIFHQGTDKKCREIERYFVRVIDLRTISEGADSKCVALRICR